MDRYRFTTDSISKAKGFLTGKTKTGPAWAKRFKEDLTVKGTKVLYKGREIIPAEKIEDVLRQEIFKRDADIPPSRDGAFHIVKQRYVGISKRKILAFLQAQRILVETKPIVAQAKVKAGKKLDKYSFETDLIFVKREDVLRADPKFEKKSVPELQYIVATTESITGLIRLALCKSKDASAVTPIVIKQLKDMAKQLKTSIMFVPDINGLYKCLSIAKVMIISHRILCQKYKMKGFYSVSNSSYIALPWYCTERARQMSYTNVCFK